MSEPKHRENIQSTGDVITYWMGAASSAEDTDNPPSVQNNWMSFMDRISYYLSRGCYIN